MKSDSIIKKKNNKKKPNVDLNKRAAHKTKCVHKNRPWKNH